MDTIAIWSNEILAKRYHERGYSCSTSNEKGQKSKSRSQVNRTKGQVAY